MQLQNFESIIHRSSPFSTRSKRLDTVVTAVNTFRNAVSEPSLRALEDALQAWRCTDPKEYTNRGKPIEHELHEAIRIAVAGNWVLRIPLVDPLSHPSYEPNIWNEAAIRRSTNCYAYACNDPYNHTPNTKPQPGNHMRLHQAGAAVRVQMTESAVRLAVMQDDQMRQRMRQQKLIPLLQLPPYHRNTPNQPPNLPGFYLIALVVDSVTARPDYHWYRQDRDGYWSHKPGHTAATNLDASMHRIADPRDCNLGRYRFCLFYYAPRGGVRTISAGDAS